MATLDDYKREYETTQITRGGLDKRYRVLRGDEAFQKAQSVYDQFSNLFKNYIGRTPTEEEFGKYYNQILRSGKSFGTVLTPGAMESMDINDADWRNQVVGFINDNFQQEAQDTAKQRLSDLSTEAGTLADSYLEMGRNSLKSIADDLKQYQVSLFDKLRPQLNMAAQAGGFQNSGGQTLQEQGALTDLANEATAYMLPLQTQLNDTANQIRFGGQSAPYSLASSFAGAQPDVLANMGSNSLNFNNDIYTRNLDTNNAARLMAYQNKLYKDRLPGFGRSLSQSFATKFGGNLADIGSDGLRSGFSSMGLPGMG